MGRSRLEGPHRTVRGDHYDTSLRFVNCFFRIGWWSEMNSKVIGFRVDWRRK